MSREKVFKIDLLKLSRCLEINNDLQGAVLLKMQN